LIIDDGSTDNSLEIVRKFNDDRIRIVSQKNSGVSAARNRGVEESQFDYIAFLDADDWWDPHFLEEMNYLLITYPYAGIYASNFKLVYPRFEKKINFNLPNNFNDGYINYYKVTSESSSPVCSSNCIINKEKFLEERGFDVSLKSGEDKLCWIKIAYHNPVVFTSHVLSYYNHCVDKVNRGSRQPPLFVFTLEQFNTMEKDNIYLKKLLDLTKIRHLKEFYIKGMYKNEVKQTLLTVDKTNIPFRFRLFYYMPPFISCIPYYINRCLYEYKMYLKNILVHDKN